MAEIERIVMPHTLSDEEFLGLAQERGGAGASDTVQETPPAPILPMSAATVAAMGTSGTNVNAPPPLDEREIALGRMGKREGVPFHQGLPILGDIGLKVRQTPEEQIRYLANTYGAENVRMNELGEPVVNIKGEDYVVDPHKLTLNSLTGLMAYAPETLATALALKRGGSDMGLFKQALVGAVAGRTATLGKEAAVRFEDQTPINLPQLIAQQAAGVPLDTAGGVALGGVFKTGQLVSDLAQGKGLPNPLARTRLLSPANPELTGEGVAAAQRLATRSGIPANLSPAEATGIPLLAQLEARQENVAAGAGPMIAAKKARDETSRAWQNWMIRPDTLGTDEEVARRGIGVLRASVEPFEKDVALERLALDQERAGNEAVINQVRNQMEMQQQAKIVTGMGVSRLPSEGVPLTETGDLIRQRVLSARDTSKANVDKLYDKFYENPAVMDPVIEGKGLKGAIDQTLRELPAVTKEVETTTGVLGPGGEPITRTAEQRVPISTPIRPRLEELSGKLAGGRVSINDLKQVRTDVGDAIKQGEAVPGIKEGRLKQLYSQLSKAIEGGLDEIGDPALKQSWEDATKAYEAHAEKFGGKVIAPLFKDAEQTTLGNADFVRQLVGNESKYVALRQFLGEGSSELAAFHKTVRNQIMENSLADGSSTAIDGDKFIRSLEALRKSNPVVYQDAVGDRGNRLIREAKILSGVQGNIPGEDLEALLDPRNTPKANSLPYLVNAEERLAKEYQNGALKDFVQGNRAELEPDKFIRFLPNYKLSDVQDVMRRLEAGDPDVAEQVRRKVAQSLFNEARRNPTPADVLASLQGKKGDIVSGSGINKALGTGDQLEKYRSLLGPDLFESMSDYAKRELLREEKMRVGGGAGMLAKGEGVSSLLNALTPGEGSRSSILKDLSMLTRDKIASWILASPKLNALLLTPHTLDQMPQIMAAIVSSEPFMKAALEESKNPGTAYKTLSTLKAAYGVAKPREQKGHTMSDDEFLRESSPR